MDKELKVLVVDDNLVNRLGVRALLKSAGIEVVGEAADGQEAVAQAGLLKPDVILMELVMPGMDGVQASREILSRQRGTRIVALTGLGADEQVLAAIRAGVRGYVHKEAPPQELLEALRGVQRGEIVFPVSLTHKLLVASTGSLTPTEAKLHALRDEWRILRTKLYRPEVPADYVVKSELLARLEAGRQLPLTLVSAGAGYGKSTLVSHWLATCEAPSAWLSLDRTDSDTTTFFRYFIAAVRTLYPDDCQDSAALLGAGGSPSARVLARCLDNDLDTIDERFVLALDDYHLIDEPAVHEIVDALLEQPALSLHLVILSRHDPPLALASLRAHHKMTELRLEDLALDEDETAAFLDKALDFSVDSRSVGRLHRMTEGWPAILRIAAMTLRDGEDLDQLVRGFGSTARQVEDYLAGELLARVSPRVRESLRRISIVDRCCAPLCETLCGNRKGSNERTSSVPSFERLLNGTELLSIPLDQQQEWYRFHHLFKELLRRQLEARTSPEEIAALHARASEWFAENRFVNLALRHAIESGDMAGAVRLVEGNVDEMMNRQRWDLVVGWLKSFPDEVVEAIPLLLVLKALSCTYRFRYAEAWKILDRAEPLVAATPPRSAADRRLRGLFEALRSQQCYVAGDAERAVDCGNQALALLPPEARDFRGATMNVLALSLQKRGDLDRAYRLLYHALAETQGSDDTFRSWVLTTLCMVHEVDGDLGGLRQAASGLLHLGQELDLRESKEWAGYFLGRYHYQRGELEAAERHLAAIEKRSLNRMVLFFHGTATLALCRLAQGRDDEARNLAESLVSCMLEDGDNFGLHLAQAFQAEVALRQGRMAEALHWARRFELDPEALRPSFMFYVPELTLAKVLVAENQPQGLCRADEVLNRLYEHASRTHNQRCSIEVLALQALLHEARGDEPAALAALVRALNLALPGGFLRVFVDLGPGLTKLLHRLELNEEGLCYVGRVLAAFRGHGPSEAENGTPAAGQAEAPAGTGPLPEPLTRREHEVLALLAQQLSNKELATRLCISPGTVKRHTHNIYEKLHVSGRRKVVAKAVGLGLLHPS